MTSLYFIAKLCVYSPLFRSEIFPMHVFEVLLLTIKAVYHFMHNDVLKTVIVPLYIFRYGYCFSGFILKFAIRFARMNL